MTSNLSFIKSGLDEIKASDILKKLFSYILAIGNVLNSGTPKDRADRFNLDVLPKITSIKDTTNKNLLQYVCTLMKKYDENFENVKKNLPKLTEAAKISFSENQTMINKMKKDIKDNTNNLNKISVEDEFTKKIKSLIDKYNTDVEKAENNYANILKTAQDMILAYGYEQKESKYKNPEEFLALIDPFLNDVDKFTPKTDTKKKVDRKHEVGKKIMENIVSQQSNNMEEVLKALKEKQNK